jgi:DinB superfamily
VRKSGIVVVASAIIGFASLVSTQGRAERLTVSAIADVWVTKTEQLVVPAADALPESLYGFAPTNGAFTSVRNFGEQVKHLAAANYQLGSRVLGEDPPVGTQNETAPESVKSKAQILEYLNGSFACLHRAAARINAGNLEAPIVVGRETQAGLGLIIDALAHSQNHYGQMVEYLRMNRVIPPESRR